MTAFPGFFSLVMSCFVSGIAFAVGFSVLGVGVELAAPTGATEGAEGVRTVGEGAEGARVAAGGICDTDEGV